MDGDLALIIGSLMVFVIVSNNFSYAKFSGDPKADTADDGARAQIRQLVGVVSYTVVWKLVSSIA